jgi:hypothetical protein
LHAVEPRLRVNAASIAFWLRLILIGLVRSSCIRPVDLSNMIAYLLKRLALRKSIWH